MSSNTTESTETYRPAFPLHPKPHISYGLPFAQACAQHIVSTFKASKVYVIVSASISKTENFRRLEEALGRDAEGKVEVVGVRKGIKPHTPWEDILEIVEEIRGSGAEVIVTLGAGSLTDGAKVISFALANNVSTLDDLFNLSKDGNLKSPNPCTIPIINIPTSLSGGEYSSLAGATDTRTHYKAQFSHPSMGAALIILSPELSISTPARFWLSSGIRAVDHCVEGLCSVDHHEESDQSFTGGLRLLVPNLLFTKKHWEDEEPRLKCMLGVIESMKGLEIAGGTISMGGSHGIGHQLGPLGVGHGETSCVMLPAILKYNYLHGDENVRKPQQKVLDILWGEKPVAKVLTKRGLKKETADAGDVVGAVISELGMPRTLKDVGVGRDKLDGLAVNCLRDPWLKTNPVPLVEKEQVLEVLKMVVGE